MSSVTRFLRQIPTGLQFYTVSSSATFYELTPSPAGGNYPNELGYVSSASVSPAPTVIASGQYLVRDMGKTIKAVAGTVSQGTFTQTNGATFFREVQIVNPSAYYTTGGVTVDGTTPTPGSAGPNGIAAYYTYYLPIAMSGLPLLPAGTVSPNLPLAPAILTPVAGGVM